MAIDLEHLHRDIIELRKEMSIIKHILSEERHLTEWAKNELKKARLEAEEDYTDLNDL